MSRIFAKALREVQDDSSRVRGNKGGGQKDKMVMAKKEQKTTKSFTSRLSPFSLALRNVQEKDRTGGKKTMKFVGREKAMEEKRDSKLEIIQDNPRWGFTSVRSNVPSSSSSFSAPLSSPETSDMRDILCALHQKDKGVCKKRAVRPTSDDIEDEIESKGSKKRPSADDGFQNTFLQKKKLSPALVEKATKLGREIVEIKDLKRMERAKLKSLEDVSKSSLVVSGFLSGQQLSDALSLLDPLLLDEDCKVYWISLRDAVIVYKSEEIARIAYEQPLNALLQVTLLKFYEDNNNKHVDTAVCKKLFSTLVKPEVENTVTNRLIGHALGIKFQYKNDS